MIAALISLRKSSLSFLFFLMNYSFVHLLLPVFWLKTSSIYQGLVFPAAPGIVIILSLERFSCFLLSALLELESFILDF